MILETARLVVREIVETDAAFILDLLNQPSFIKYIGDRQVRDLEQARIYIEDRFRKSYAENGFGLWAVELKAAFVPDSAGGVPAIGICGFVRRDSLPGADLGFAFLPQFEKKGFAFEAAGTIMQYGREVLGLHQLLAITTQDNDNSVKLLEKLGFRFERLIKMPHDAEDLKLFSASL